MTSSQEKTLDGQAGGASLPPLVRLYKKRGETPLECIEAFRKAHSEYKTEKMSYLGRLDPMAEGLLLVAVGETNKVREQYLGLPKEYVFEVLFGFETDTYDLLGIISGADSGRQDLFEHASFSAEKVLCSPETSVCARLLKTLPFFKGKHIQSYPPFSSRTIGGKPLWEITRNGGLAEVVIPQIEIEIFDLVLLNTSIVTKEFLQTEIPALVSKVKGDFRQAEITQAWQEVLQDSSLAEYTIAQFKISCSSGTYVRSLVHHIGEKLGCGAVAYSIKRTKVGTFE